MKRIATSRVGNKQASQAKSPQLAGLPYLTEIAVQKIPNPYNISIGHISVRP